MIYKVFIRKSTEYVLAIDAIKTPKAPNKKNICIRALLV